MNFNKIKEKIPIIVILLSSILLTILLHISGAFSYIELKLYDFRFGLRGAISGTPLYMDTKLPSAEYFIDENDNNTYDKDIDTFNTEGVGCWDEEDCIDPCEDDMVCHNQQCVEYTECHDINQNGKWDKGLDVVLVEIDDETYEYLNEPYPYKRSIWGNAIRNLTNAGAKVITIDIEFDKPDHQIENLKRNLSKEELSKVNYIDGDKHLSESIRFAKENGTDVILAYKIATDKDRVPSRYRAMPHKSLITSKDTPYAALVDIEGGIDGIHRLYPIFHAISYADTSKYYTLAVSSVLRYLDVETDPKPIIDKENYIFNVGPLNIPVYGKSQLFLMNYYGPSSHSFKTFRKYPLVNILDTENYLIGDEYSAYCLDDWDEIDSRYSNKEDCERNEEYRWTTEYDSNWMDQYINPDHPLYFRFKDNNPFKGKIVYIGTSLAEHHDFKNTPFLNYKGGTFPTPGMEVHANATQQLIDSNYIQYPLGKLAGDNEYFLIHFLIIIFLVLITLIIVTRLEPIPGFLFASSLLFIWFSLSIGLFLHDYFWLIKFMYNSIFEIPWGINMPSYNESAVIPVVFPMAAIIIPYGINLSYNLILENNNKKFLKDSFGQYISPDLIDQMFDEKKEPKLGGDPGYHSMLFSDIASFSTFSEKLEAESLLSLLNEYLTTMTNILVENKGTLDKYIGDAIVAFYGAPVELDNHEYRACLTALEMEKKLSGLRVKWKAEGDKWPKIVHNMQHRIGINAGHIVVGNMGSEMKMNYTMTGDKVNLTARLESSAKQLGIVIQVSDTIYNKVKDNFIFRDLGKVVVVGRNQSLNTYELICKKGEEDKNTVELLRIFHLGLEEYMNQNWDKAIELFEKSSKLEENFEARKTNPSKVFIDRSRNFKENPPPKNWDGDYSLQSK